MNITNPATESIFIGQQIFLCTTVAGRSEICMVAADCRLLFITWIKIDQKKAIL